MRKTASKASRPVKRLGVIGGAFDPIHKGHLFIARHARKALKLDRILFVPCGIAPHKRKMATGKRHRLAMLRRAIAYNPRFEVCTLEMNRKTKSYTIHTVESLKKKWPEWELFFLAGADNLTEIRTWKDYRKLLNTCQWGVVSRPRYDFRIPSFFPKKKTHMLRASAPDISSTDIRNRVRTGKSVRTLLPAPVFDYIREHGLYCS